MVAEPAATPVTIPDTPPTVATAVLLLVQVPPEVLSVRKADELIQKTEGPEMPGMAKEATDNNKAIIVKYNLLI